MGFDPTAASHQARLSYSVYLGFLQLQRQHQTPSLSSEEYDAYIEHIINTLIPKDDESPAEIGHGLNFR